MDRFLGEMFNYMKRNRLFILLACTAILAAVLVGAIGSSLLSTNVFASPPADITEHFDERSPDSNDAFTGRLGDFFDLGEKKTSVGSDITSIPVEFNLLRDGEVEMPVFSQADMEFLWQFGEDKYNERTLRTGFIMLGAGDQVT
jgi:hypothetical protein